MHHSHQRTLQTVILVLVPLAMVQFLAWLLPTPADWRGLDYYLPLHSLMEAASIVIAMMVFAVGWNSHSRNISGNVVVLACLFFAIGLLDFSHTASYAGMPDFITPNDAEKQLYFWLSARFLAALALLIVVIRAWDPVLSRIRAYALLALLVAAVLGINWVVVFHQSWLPHMFIPGQGLTPLKKGLEYLFIAMNLVTAVLLWRKMQRPQPFNAALLFGAVCTMAMSEFYFTLYTTMTGAYNVLGHVYKVISYVFIYRAVVVEAVETPYKKLDEAQNSLALAVGASNTGLWDWEVGAEYAYYSPVWKSQLGYADHELANRRSTWEALLHPDDLERAKAHMQAFLDSPTQHIYESEFRMRHRDGGYHWILARGEKHVGSNGAAVRLLGAHIDITDRKQAEERFHYAVEAAPNAMIMVDERGLIVLSNSRTAEMFGYTEAELLGQSVSILIPPSLHQAHAGHMHAYFKGAPGRRMGGGRDLYGCHKNGRELPIEVGLNPFETTQGRYVIASVTDITERKQAEKHIQQLANFDVLTGLPNRHQLDERVHQAISAAKRDHGRVSVLFIDLDHFKNINDSLGHRIGDLLLVDVAKRLKAVVRSRDTVSRMGGDEFVVVLTEDPGDHDMDVAARVAMKLLSVVGKPYRVENHELVITPSIGIAVYPEDGIDFETLYRHADTAMYRAKSDGRNDFRFFTKEMQLRTARTLRLENALHRALNQQQLYLHYQPQLSIPDGRVIGVEALVRWHHPEFGAVSPAEFIPIAEGNGQIIAIGSWVLRTAVQQLKAWREAGLPPMVMAVNLSAVQFRHPNLPGMVSQVLQEAQVPPEWLELELTEGVAMDDPLGAITTMENLHERGVRMSIDDFGTGYSSLSYLKKFSVYKLKIDQSFVRDIATDANDCAIVRAIIQLSHSLGFKTIAEGVETQAQQAFLIEQGCDEVQGYLYSKPLPAEQLEAFVRAKLA